VGAESIRLDTDGPRGVLILHGFNDTPQSVRALAEWMHAAGWGVRAPLLPGHGRTRVEFEASGGAAAWMATAREAWAEVQARYPTAVVMGQSMGGALAVWLAAQRPAPTAVVLFAPYLAMGFRARLLSYLWPVWRVLLPELRGKPERGLVDREARSRSLGGGAFTPRMVGELRQVVDRARGVAGRVLAPVLVVQGRRDYRVPASSVRSGFGVIGSSDKTLVWRDGVGHVVAADVGREGVFDLVGEWLRGRV